MDECVLVFLRVTVEARGHVGVDGDKVVTTLALLWLTLTFALSHSCLFIVSKRGVPF